MVAELKSRGGRQVTSDGGCGLGWGIMDRWRVDGYVSGAEAAESINSRAHKSKGKTANHRVARGPSG